MSWILQAEAALVILNQDHNPCCVAMTMKGSIRRGNTLYDIISGWVLVVICLEEV